jgi:uncharacterized membrane protein
MSTLEEQIDVNASADTAWEHLHRVEAYPEFIGGVRQAQAGEGGHRAHLDLDPGGRLRVCDAEITDRGRGRMMAFKTTDSSHLSGTFSLLPIDERHTRVQLRLEYDPDEVRSTFGGPRGFAQSSAIERLVHDDLQHFKGLVERG